MRQAVMAVICMLFASAAASQDMSPPGAHENHNDYQEMMAKNGYSCPCSANRGECRAAPVIFPTLKQGEELVNVIVDLGGGLKCPFPYKDIKYPEYVPLGLLRAGAHACAYPITVPDQNSRTQSLPDDPCKRVRIGCVFVTQSG